MYTIVFSIIRRVADPHALWRKKTFLSYVQLACADQATQQVRVFRHLIKWKPPLWLHWTVADNARFLRTYGSMYMFSSVPMEVHNSPLKTHLQNCFRGWSVHNLRISKRGMAHILQMYALNELVQKV